MNKIRLILSLVVAFMALQLTAQDVLPQAINFQAVARDADGHPLANTNIMIQLTVLDGSPDGQAVYREIRALQTNAYGGFNFMIGSEPYIADGEFADIDWAGGRKFLKIDYDQTNTMSFDLSLGTIEFVSVPYSFVAGRALEESDPTVPAWAKEDEKPVYDYSEIQNTPEIPEVPENISAFNNDAGYLTSYTETQTLADVVANGNSANAQIKNVTDPVEAQDAATKAYVDLMMRKLLNSQGALIGVFSVSDTTHVRFSKGNLQYKPSTGEWRFAKKQWDYVGNVDYLYLLDEYEGENGLYEYFPGWMDLFSWGTGSDPTNMEPGRINSYENKYFVDWGVNPISNGGKVANIWRTLTKDEWEYLLFTRSTNSGIRYAKAEVNGVNGYIILPDDWNSVYYTLNHTNDYYQVHYNVNTITSGDWAVLEANGAVFLPAAGFRGGSEYISVYGDGTHGSYWSSTPDGESWYDFWYVLFEEYNLIVEYAQSSSYIIGQSVRLVQDVEW